MKIIIGAGCVGLSVAYKLFQKFNTAEDILIIDKYNIPTKGTSLRNSGVLHAGLYYPKGSEKSDLCIRGGEELFDLCQNNNLPILNSGKLLVPFNQKDEDNLQKLYKNAKNCGRDVHLINYQEASKIQPGIKKNNLYLWSPKTSVFSPNNVLNFLYKKLLENGAKFLRDSVLDFNVKDSKVHTKNNGVLNYRYLFNCSGPGALKLARNVNLSYKNLTVLPILGQYGIIPEKQFLKTNVYPVPDPNLPFLGVHVTPLTDGNILVGPNAVPIFKNDVQGYEFDDFLNIFPNLFFHSKLFISNTQNYRVHALNELNISTLNKFKTEACKLINFNEKIISSTYMAKNTYGIRPQLYDKENNRFVDDFIFDINENTINIVNAVSPAFTSCLALAKKIVDTI